MILITGATGFVGRYLVQELLNNNNKVIACGRNPQAKKFFNSLGIDLIDIDIVDYSSFNILPAENVSSIIHLAAIIPAAVKHEPSDIYLRINTLGTFNLLKFAVENQIPRFINTTTRFEVDLLHGHQLIKEEQGRKYQLHGHHAAYVISKVAAAEYVDHFSKEYGIAGLTLRLTGLYGAGRYPGYTHQGKYYPYATEIFIQKAKNGEDIEIWDDTIYRDNLYVKDAVNGIIAANAGKKANGVYNLASGKFYKLSEYVEAICNIFNPTNKKSQVFIKNQAENKASNTQDSYVFDINKMLNDFAWCPQYDLQSAMKDYSHELVKGQFVF